MRIAVIPGDGIGKEVTAEAVKVLKAVCDVAGKKLDLETLPWGADHFLATGITIPPNGHDMLRDEFSAILLGALGDPRVPDNRTARDILLSTRFALDLYINFRPVRLIDDRLWPLKDRGKKDVNFVVFRENTEGVYVGIGGRFKAGTPDEVSVQEEINTYKGVHRIVRRAFEYAHEYGLTKVCMADKSNAMPDGHALWQRVFREVAVEFPSIKPTHLYIDALAMFLVKDPGQFEVIVTNNLFGDIITDIGGALQGGLGMAASGNIHPGQDVALRARARIGAAACGQEHRQPDGRDPVRGADARDRRLEGRSEAHRSRRRIRRARTADDDGHRRDARDITSRGLDRETDQAVEQRDEST